MGRRVALGVLVVLVLAAAATIYLLRFRRDTTTTTVGVERAVETFRAQTTLPASSSSAVPATSAVAAPPVLPAPGVYTYATTGGDRIDALGGAAHTYPSTTTITVTAAGCGVRQLWVAAEERSDEFVTCAVPAGVRLDGFTASHRFFGQDEVERHTCTGEPRPVGAAPGTTWIAHCVQGGAASIWTGRVVGVAVVSVAGREVDTERVVVTIDDGVVGDVQRTETWYQRGTDLVVRRVVDNATTNSSVVGDVHYREHYEITLASLTPAR